MSRPRSAWLIVTSLPHGRTIFSTNYLHVKADWWKRADVKGRATDTADASECNTWTWHTRKRVRANAPSASTIPLRHVAMLNSQGGNLTFKCAANRNQVRCTDAALSRTHNFRMQCEFSRYRRAIRATSSWSLLPMKEHISKQGWQLRRIPNSAIGKGRGGIARGTVPKWNRKSWWC